MLWIPYIHSSLAFGVNQFANTPGRGTGDALCFYLLEWISGINRGEKILVYCSDASGAFDRVDHHRLLVKLHSKGLHPRIIRVLESWLRTRSARVVVDGISSSPFDLVDQVYQGTVYGPPLWNIFYADAPLCCQQYRI